MNNFFLEKIVQLRAELDGQVMVDPIVRLRRWLSTKSEAITPGQFQFVEVTEEKVRKVLNNLSPTKSCGLDWIDGFSLKCASTHIIVPLTHIINLSIRKGKFPEIWKSFKVVAVFKKGDKSSCKNYRPVSLLSVVSKILERVMYDQLVQYLTENELLDPNHHGFRQNRSTTTAILNLYDLWIRAAEKGQLSAAAENCKFSKILYLD